MLPSTNCLFCKTEEIYCYPLIYNDKIIYLGGLTCCAQAEKQTNKMRFAHTNIVSTDWKKLIEFYINVFDCKIVPPIRNQSGEFLDKGIGLKGAKLQGAHLSLPGYDKNAPTLEIYQYEDTENQEYVAPNKRGFGHIAFEVDDVEKILKKVIENGGQKCGEITKKKIEGAGKISFIYTRDPEGNLIELQNWK